MTTGASRDSERFADAVDHGYTYAGAVPPGDEVLARELELVALLRESRASLAPSQDASARMRARVMAAAATMVAQPSTEDDSDHIDSYSATLVTEYDEVNEVAQATEETNVVSIGSAKGRHRFPRRAAATETPHRRSALGVSAAAALALLAVTGGGALFSKDALPGDTLYGVKQTTESGMVALTPGGNKAQRQLDVAATRIDEVQALNNSRAASTDRGTDISQALRGFNEQTTAASRTWMSAPNSNDAGALAGWANTQSQRLSSMRAAMPESARPDADASMRMLDQLRTRANAMNSRKGCDTVTTGQSDEFGPIPARGTCSGKDVDPAPKQVVPNAPTNGRTSVPSLPTHDSAGTGQLPPNQLPADGGDATDGPDLNLPELPGAGPDGLLPKSDSATDNAPRTGLPLNLPPLFGN